MWRRTLIAVAVVAALLVWRYYPRAGQQGGGGGGTATIRVERPLMGTLWSIEVAPHGRTDAARAAIEDAYAEVVRIEKAMSEWLPDSPVSAVNAAAGRGAVEVPDELRAILLRARDYSLASEGAFDVTWRGMGRIWRFDEQFRVPAAEEVERARRNIDYRALHIEGNRVSLARAGMAIGLGGIAKGYAVDRAARMLRDAGFSDSLVAGAGDILASGTKQGAPWRIGIQDPRGERGQLLGALEVSGAAVSTSGDYERFRMADGERYHHIIDPRTGWPARASITASVMAPSSEQADALATAIFILGPEKGLALAAAQKVDALVIDAEGRRHAGGAYRYLK